MCYFFSQTSKTFSQAVIDCKQKGGKLAEPKDDRTRKILIDNAIGWPWIGIETKHRESPCQYCTRD